MSEWVKRHRGIPEEAGTPGAPVGWAPGEKWSQN